MCFLFLCALLSDTNIFEHVVEVIAEVTNIPLQMLNITQQIKTFQEEVFHLQMFDVPCGEVHHTRIDYLWSNTN